MNRKALAELQNMQNSCLGGVRVSRVMPVRLGPIAPRNRRLSGKDRFLAFDRYEQNASHVSSIRKSSTRPN